MTELDSALTPKMEKKPQALSDYLKTNKLLQNYLHHHIELDVPQRRTANTPHHADSKLIMSHLQQLDHVNGTPLNLKTGINLGLYGDNGESLLYLLDMFFEWIDKQELPNAAHTPTHHESQGSTRDTPQNKQTL
jgi:hypothetical protein